MAACAHSCELCASDIHIASELEVAHYFENVCDLPPTDAASTFFKTYEIMIVGENGYRQMADVMRA